VPVRTDDELRTIWKIGAEKQSGLICSKFELIWFMEKTFLNSTPKNDHLGNGRSLHDETKSSDVWSIVDSLLEPSAFEVSDEAAAEKYTIWVGGSSDAGLQPVDIEVNGSKKWRGIEIMRISPDVINVIGALLLLLLSTSTLF
jgi:hypothetical protein